MKNLSVKYQTEVVSPGGNWNGPGDWLPRINVDQETGQITVTRFESRGYEKKASVETTEISDTTEGNVSLIRGEVQVKNWKNPKCSGSQKFVFAVFEGDSGHIYIHRAPATKGWLECTPKSVLKRLRKLGIGADKGVIQQGDFLLKPAGANAYPDEDFAHERMGAGHHNFELPQLYHRGQFWVKEPTKLIHTAVDGIQHPDVIVPPGKYIVGTTAVQLNHSNKRD
ncbi:hypothetical protein JXQ70_19860 [bacterium]|nr:hypothetical protein [bacterium]